jgi:hypothetical protein
MTLLMDQGGLIEEIALCNPAGIANRDLLRAHGNIIAQMPGVKVWLVCRREDEAALERWASRAGLGNVQIVPVDAPLGPDAMWIQDPFVVRVGRRGRPSYESIVAEHDYDYAGWLGAAQGREVSHNRLRLTGGNLLVGRDFRIVGAESIAGPGGSPQVLGRALPRHRDFDPRPLHVYGYRNGPGGRWGQTPFHLDLALALTGCRTVRNEPIVLLAKPAWDAPALDAAAARLEADGFCVLRNRLPGRDKRLRYYNNVLVENVVRPGEIASLVFVPHYGRSADAQVDAVWKMLGFTPRPIDGWSFGLFPGGALRCATKVLRRGPAPGRDRLIGDDVLAAIRALTL